MHVHTPVAGDGVLWCWVSDRPVQVHQEQDSEGGLDCLRVQGGAQGMCARQTASTGFVYINNL